MRRKSKVRADGDERTHSAVAEQWLVNLDAQAVLRPRASDWLDYSCFELARYRGLRPKVDRNASTRARDDAKSSCGTFWGLITKWKSRIFRHEDTQRVFDGLSPQEKTELAALLVDIDSSLYVYHNNSDWNNRVRKLAREKPRRERMLKRKLKKIHDARTQFINAIERGSSKRIWRSALRNHRAAFEDLVQYRKGLDLELQKSLPLKEHQSLPLKERLPLPLPQSMSLPEFADLLSNPESHSTPVDPVPMAMVQIYAFLVRSCGLSQNEAEVRVGLLRNAFWTKYGVSKVRIYHYDHATDSAGCPAVKAAVRRYASR
jgi:hypothetical protein